MGLINGDDDLWAVISTVALGKNLDKVIIGFVHEVVGHIYESYVN